MLKTTIWKPLPLRSILQLPLRLAKTHRPLSISHYSRNMAARQQPEWFKPQAQELKLRLNNSLTKSKEDFLSASGTKSISWYNCGPTVYDASHIGHARVYVTIDIMRRVMEDYFKYNVNFVMNITDIDDKIIIRARQNYLFDKLRNGSSALTSELVAKTQLAWEEYIKSKLTKCSAALLNGADPLANFDQLTARVLQKDKTVMEYALQEEEKLFMYITTAMTTRDAIEAANNVLKNGDKSKAAAETLLDNSKDVVSIQLDKEEGHTVTDPKIFRDLAAFWENDFLADMDALNVRRCNVMPRVSEYIPEIVNFVKGIIANKFAYLTEDGSVYFDSAAFDGAYSDQKGASDCAKVKHAYAKLEPWNAGNINLIAEGEGSLGAKLSGKKKASDFALWKASKPGEPAWEVEGWGKGRPGWHIECSAMGSSILGSKIDIHSGGIDLKFPHHDNELAQSEAFYDCEQWVNYFLHVGHLHIEGAKMSKSLKNFIPIREALKNYTSRQLRIRFLMSGWDAPMDFKATTMEAAKTHERILNNFFSQINARVAESRGDAQESTGSHTYLEKEQQLSKMLEEKQAAVHVALSDSINTPKAWEEIMDLVSKTNQYIASGDVHIQLLQRVSAWVTDMCKVFGLVEGNSAIGFGASFADGKADSQEALLPYLQCLSKFRDEIRTLAMNKEDPSAFLKLCDRLRDEDLVDLGVALDDQESGRALVKLLPREDLIRERENKRKKEAEKAKNKAEAAAAKEAKRLEREAKGKISPAVYFKEAPEYKGEFSRFDDEGLPTHDKDGAEVAKSRRKKLAKEYATQEKLHAAYLADTQNSKNV